MATKWVSGVDIDDMLKDVPENLKAISRSSNPIPLENVFPGEANADIRRSLRETGVANLGAGRGKIGAFLNNEGYVVGVAAKVPRTPTTTSFTQVSDILDFDEDNTDREDKIPVYYRIYKKEGLINNAINKTAAFVSAEGDFYVRRARSGNRKIPKVEEELGVALNYWMRNVNSAGLDGPVTGARGLSAIIDQGTRQALIEGSWVAYQHYSSVDVPQAGKTFELPMFLQSLSTQYVTIPDALVGTGLEQFYWEPPNEIIQGLVDSDDPDVTEALQNAFDPDVISQLSNDQRVKLEKDRVVHVKHRGTDIEPFGESFIEPVLSSLAYRRALQTLDLVIIESLINRVLIIKVGSDKPDSAYHNIEFAQQRVNVLANMFDTTDPSMTVLWAGPDIDVIDVGVHNSLADLDGRFQRADARMIYDMGVPENLLTGGGGQGQQWAAYEGYRETLRSMQNAYAQAMVSIGEQIALRNGYEGVELEFKFARSVLADQSANADLAMRKRKDGLASIRSTIAATGGDYLSERRNRLLEKGLDPDAEGDTVTDDELFTPPFGLLGETRVDPNGNVKDPGGESGRPPDSQREDLAPEREQENRNPGDGE